MITVRKYQWPEDFDLVGDFLKANLGDPHQSSNWTQARWEYMHYHPAVDSDTLGLNGIWEDDGDIVAVVHVELDKGDVYLQVKEGYEHLKGAMLDYAEEHLSIEKKNGKYRLRVFVNDFDEDLQSLLKQRGYGIKYPIAEAESTMVLPDTIELPSLPEGYAIQSLEDENNLEKVDRLMWRGFNHEGEPPKGSIDGRKLMQSAPNFDKSLNIYVRDNEGQYCAYAGMWYDDVNKLCYVEPVCTDPDFRRKGLGRLAVLEGIRRCQSKGAIVAKVGSRQAFYKAMGFKEVYSRQLWYKCLSK